MPKCSVCRQRNTRPSKPRQSKKHNFKERPIGCLSLFLQNRRNLKYDKLLFIGEGHNVRSHPVRKVLPPLGVAFFKSDPPVILRPQACGALRALARWFISLAPPPSRERTLWLKLTSCKSIPLSQLLGVCHFFFASRGAKKKLTKRNAAPAGREVAF